MSERLSNVVLRYAIASDRVDFDRNQVRISINATIDMGDDPDPDRIPAEVLDELQRSDELRESIACVVRELCTGGAR